MDRPETKPGVGKRSDKAKTFKKMTYCCANYCSIVILSNGDLHSIVFTYYIVKKPKLSQTAKLNFEANNKRNEPNFQNLAEKKPC